MQRACSPTCAIEMAHADKLRKAVKAAKDDRKMTRAKLEAIKPRSKLLAEAQAAVNRYVRLRDAGKPCISCGVMYADIYQAGHYRSTRAAPELRFSTDNIHKQCVQCNMHFAGNLIMYRAGLLERIGPDRLAALEGPHEAVKWTRDDLRQIKETFARMAKELE
jgi:hypothetical protein